MNKKGQLTTTQLVGLVFAIVAFLIAAFATFQILGKNTEDVFTRETCHISVLTRATVPDLTQQKIPLKCTTDKFCFTTLNDGKCAQFAGEDLKSIQRVELPKDAPRAARIIERVSANALYDCWTTMGEGKLDIFGTALSELGLTSDAKPTCVVCSRLAVADDIRRDDVFYTSLKENINVNSFLENTPVALGGDTYLSLLSQRGITGFRPLDDYKFDFKVKDSVQASADSDQIAFIFSQVRSNKVADVLNNLGFAAVAGIFVIPGGTGASVALGSTFPLATIAFGGVVAGTASVNALLGQQAAAGYCGKFTSVAGDDVPGCSLVRAVNYNIDDLRAFCPGNIQGNP